MLTCKDATALVSRAQDGPLPWRDRIALRFHLVMCAYCARFERQLRFLGKVSKALAERSTDEHATEGPDEPRLSDETRARMKKCLPQLNP